MKHPSLVALAVVGLFVALSFPGTQSTLADVIVSSSSDQSSEPAASSFASSLPDGSSSSDAEAFSSAVSSFLAGSDSSIASSIASGIPSSVPESSASSDAAYSQSSYGWSESFSSPTSSAPSSSSSSTSSLPRCTDEEGTSCSTNAVGSSQVCKDDLFICQAQRCCANPNPGGIGQVWMQGAGCFQVAGYAVEDGNWNNWIRCEQSNPASLEYTKQRASDFCRDNFGSVFTKNLTCTTVDEPNWFDCTSTTTCRFDCVILPTDNYIISQEPRCGAQASAAAASLSSSSSSN